MVITQNQMKYLRDFAETICKTTKPGDRPEKWRKYSGEISLFIRKKKAKIAQELLLEIYNQALLVEADALTAEFLRESIRNMKANVPYVEIEHTKPHSVMLQFSLQRFVASISNHVNDEEMLQVANRYRGNYLVIKNAMRAGFITISSLTVRPRKVSASYGAQPSIVFVERTKMVSGGYFRCGGALFANSGHLYFLGKLRRSSDVRLMTVRESPDGRPRSRTPMPGLMLGVSSDRRVFCSRVVLMRLEDNTKVVNLLGTWESASSPVDMTQLKDMIVNKISPDEVLAMYDGEAE